MLMPIHRQFSMNRHFILKLQRIDMAKEVGIIILVDLLQVLSLMAMDV